MTPTELKLATLRKLKVIAAGEDANADDFELIGKKYESLHAMLLEKELVIWSLTENIPKKAEQPLIMMLAAFAADEFGVPEPRATLLKAEGALDLMPPSLAERQLRKALANKYVSNPLRTTYY